MLIRLDALGSASALVAVLSFSHQALAQASPGQEAAPPATITAAPPSAAPPAAPASPAASAAPASPVAQPAAAPASPVAPPPAAAAAAPASGAPAPNDPATPGLFGIGALDNVAEEANLNLKFYGDMGFTVRDHTDLPPTGTNQYAPGVWNTFYAPRLDVFGSAEVGKLSMLTELAFEAVNNNYSTDVERIQLSYLVTEWLRLRVGRMHTAFGYYSDAYHHGRIFDLTTDRPFAVNFEDSAGIITTHVVGGAADGMVSLGGAGRFHYDAQVGNGRASDITAVDMQFSELNSKLVNIRLRYLPPVDGLIFGINGFHDVIPGLPSPAAGIPARPDTEQLIVGAHVAYLDLGWHVIVEGYAIRDNPTGLAGTTMFGGFAELGYAIKAFTPYVRGEYIRFPNGGDIVYQYSANSAEGSLGTQSPYGLSPYANTTDFADMRVGVKWLALPQVSVAVEGERLSHDARDQESATIKFAFGF